MATPSYPSYEREKGPGRPPNAWIIYRKTKLATLPPVPPGQPRRAQAEVSKIISKMWREESDIVKADYERRAEQQKALHLRKFPGYKFNPESKAEKERRKAARAAQKELERANSKRGRTQAAPYLVPVLAGPPSAHTPGDVYDPVSLYGNAGPSPAVSGASSPTSSKSAPQSLPPTGSQLYPAQSSAHSSPSADPYQNQQNCEVRPSSAPGMYAVPMPPLQAPRPDIVHPPLPDPNQYQQQNQPQQDNFAGDLTPWTHIPSNDGQVTLQGVTAEGYALHQAMSWNGEQSTDVQHATAFATNDPSIYSLEGLDFNSFLDDSPSQIEVSMGTQEMPFPLDLQSAPYAQFANLFGTYDYADLSGASSSQNTDNTSVGSSRTLSPMQIAAPPSFFSRAPETPSRVSSSSTMPQQNAMSPITPQSFFNNSVAGSRTSSGASSFTYPQQHQVHPLYGQDAFQQYFNFDDHSSLSPLDNNTTPPRPVPPSHSQAMPVMAHSSQRTSPPQTSYVPPSAAAHPGARRVAGSWRPPRSEPSSPAEHSPTGMWSYPVTARS